MTVIVKTEGAMVEEFELLIGCDEQEWRDLFISKSEGKWISGRLMVTRFISNHERMKATASRVSSNDDDGSRVSSLGGQCTLGQQK